MSWQLCKFIFFSNIATQVTIQPRLFSLSSYLRKTISLVITCIILNTSNFFCKHILEAFIQFPFLLLHYKILSNFILEGYFSYLCIYLQKLHQEIIKCRRHLWKYFSNDHWIQKQQEGIGLHEVQLSIKKSHWTPGCSCSCWEVKTTRVLSKCTSNNILCVAKNKVFVVKLTLLKN